MRSARVDPFVKTIRASSAVGALALVTGTAWAEPPEKRAIPDYDGIGNRGGEDDAPATRQDVFDFLLFAPRLALLPAYAVSEYVVRAPIGGLTRTAEKHHWPGTIYELFTSDDRERGLFPSAFFDFGMRPSVGFFFFWNDFVKKDNDLRFHFGTWGPTWINVTLLDRYTWAPGKSVGLRGAFSRRSDLYFNGLGPESSPDNQSRYETFRLDVGPTLEIDGWRLSSLRLGAGLRRIDFGDGTCCSDPSIADRVAQGVFRELPYHFTSPYTSAYQRAQVIIDSRRPKPHTGTGFRVEGYAEPAFHPRRTGQPESWIRYGGSIGQTLDLNGYQRNLSLTVSGDFADPMLGADVPFNEQVTLGGGQVAGFDAEDWKPGYPNPAFSRMTEHDGAWMARVLARIGDDVVNAAVDSAQLPSAEDGGYLKRTLIGRRDAILRRYLARLSPVGGLRVEGDAICGTDFARASGAFPTAAFRYDASVDGAAAVSVNVDKNEAGKVCVVAGRHAQTVRIRMTNNQALGPLDIYVASNGRLIGARRPLP